MTAGDLIHFKMSLSQAEGTGLMSSFIQDADFKSFTRKIEGQ